ncbi:DsbA family protein [Natronocella acetinitrilica]
MWQNGWIASTTTAMLTALGLPAREIIETAESPSNKEHLRQQTDEALARGIFGAPTFFVGDEMFWGNDRLDDAMDRLRSRESTLY